MKTKDGVAHVSYNSAKKTFVSLSNTRGQYLDKCLLLSVWYSTCFLAIKHSNDHTNARDYCPCY